MLTQKNLKQNILTHSYRGALHKRIVKLGEQWTIPK